MEEQNQKEQEFSLRRSLIIEDFKTFFESSLHSRNRILTLREWEITIIIAVFVYTSAQGSSSGFFNASIAIIISFAILELFSRGRHHLKNLLSIDVEKMISDSDDQFIIENYPFRVTRWADISYKRKAKAVLARFIAPSFISWNFAMTLLIIVLALVH